MTSVLHNFLVVLFDCLRHHMNQKRQTYKITRINCARRQDAVIVIRLQQ
jgi:hypothetical protein